MRHSVEIMYGNFLLRFFGKKFRENNSYTKEVTKAERVDFTKYFFIERVFPHCAVHTVEKREIHCHAKFFRQINSE